MKKIMFATIVAVAAVSGFIGYSKATTSSLNALALANIEALTRYELPGVTIECSKGEGDCYVEEYTRWVMCGEHTFHPCYFSGSQNDYCKTPC